MELNGEQIIKALECCANNDECVGEACPYYATGCEKSMPKDALSLIKELTAENEQLRTRHASLDRQIRADARREFAEKLKNYYFNTLKGSTSSTLVAYHIDQILEDIERKEEQ